MVNFDENYFLQQLKNLLAIDSTTGQYKEIQKYLENEIAAMGYPVYLTHKGGLISDIGGEGNDLVITAHVDDIGLMVRHVNNDGTLNVVSVGGLYPFYCMNANVRVHTRDGQIYTGTVCRTPNSIHVTEEELRSTAPDFRKNVCIVLDEEVTSAADVEKLGIETGDMIALEPRFTMSNGYLKSHFLDDKADAAICLAVMKYVKDNNVQLNRKVKMYFAVYEEIGHGTSWLPEGVRDILALDIAPLGPQQTSDEHKVSIFAKDSRYPYHYEMANELRACAKANGINYVMDVFTPHYGSDGDTSIAAGHDVRHAAIGQGTMNSHGYERNHMDGLNAVYQLVMAYITK